MEELKVGQRIYNGGDMANPDHFGTITRVEISIKWGTHYEITPDADAERKPYVVSACAFSETYLGHGGTRFVTMEAYNAWRASKMSRLMANVKKG
jgi:hypothetical protein